MTERNLALVYEPTIIKQGEFDLVDARELHRTLKSRYQYSDWVKAKIINTLFKEGFDYFSEKTEKLGVGRKGNTYYLTMDACKHIAMLENNEIGYAVRSKFIAKEKELRGISQLPKEQQLFKGLKAEKINGRKLYPYRELLGKIGYNNTSGGCGARVHKYPGHFVKMGAIWHITEEFALHLHHQKQVFNNRVTLKAMQPVLALNFGEGLV